LPFLLAHIEVIVASRSPPIYARRGLTGNKAAILPEILARPGSPATMQAMHHSGSHPTRVQDQPRHGGGQRPAGAHRGSDGRDIGPGRIHSNRPSRAFRRPTTPWMVSPSARAANVNAMRCSRTGSANATTSSIEGA